MIGLILGAGEGKRLRPYTEDRPKCLVELAGRTLLERECDALGAAGIERIHVVTGYRADAIERLGLPTFHNPRYASTNMVASMMAAAELFDGSDDVLVSYADIVYEPRVVEALATADAAVALAINTEWRALWEARMSDPLSDAETLKLDAEGNVVELGKPARSFDEIEGQYMGLIRLRADSAARLGEVHAALDPEARYDGKDLDNMYMTSFLQHWIDTVSPVRAVPVAGGWLEVDTCEDLELYSGLAARAELDRFCRLD